MDGRSKAIAIFMSASPSLSHIKDLVKGFCLGVANIIPGVSGGTFLLIFGIYERVFTILSEINKTTILTFLTRLGALAKFHKAGLAELICFMKEKDFFFLIRLGLGAFAAILGLSGLMKYLLLHQFVVTYALFFGLILVSVVIPVKMFKHLHWGLLLLVLVGTGVTVGVAWGVNPYDKIKFKSDRLAQAYEAAADSGAGFQSPEGERSQGTNAAGKYGVKDYLFIALCGAVAISATVLPGISGSLVLILMGAYFDVISAISDLGTLHWETLAYLCAFGVGVAFGGLMFSRLVRFVLSRYYDATMAVLTGLMIGSLYALWPFKEVVVMARQFVKDGSGIRLLENVPVTTNINRLPGSDDPLVWACVAFLVGCGIMVLFVRADRPASDAGRANGL